MFPSLTNVSASTVARNLSDQARALEKSQAKLSSGCKVLTPEDDAGGLAVSLKLQSQVHALDAYETLLDGASSFVELQSAALSDVARVLQRKEELKTLKLDPTKTLTDTQLYDTEIASLNLELGRIGEEKYNGVRLFSSGSGEDFLALDTAALNGGSLPLVRPPLNVSTTTQVFPNPLDVVFLIDLTGSMSSTITQLRSTIGTFFDNLPSSVLSWRARVVGYRDEYVASDPAYIEVGDFVSSKADVSAQLIDPAIYAAGGGDSPETLEDALYKVANGSNWSSSTDVKRMVVAFTDAAPKEPPKVASRAEILNTLNAKGIDLTICGSNDSATEEFVSDSGAVFEDYYGVLGDMSGFLKKFAVRSDTNTTITRGLTIEETASYLARKGAESSVISTLKDHQSSIRINLENAVGKILDTDVASEMSSMIRRRVLVDSGAAMLKRANESMDAIIVMLESVRVK
ncbi:MAG: flagellin [Verrucomicrobiota bacterium]